MAGVREESRNTEPDRGFLGGRQRPRDRARLRPRDRNGHRGDPPLDQRGRRRGRQGGPGGLPRLGLDPRHRAGPPLLPLQDAARAPRAACPVWSWPPVIERVRLFFRYKMLLEEHFEELRDWSPWRTART